MSCAAHGLALSRGLLVTEDVDLIREAVAMLPQDRPVLVVDLGAGSGTSALSVFAERSHGIAVVTVDKSEVALASSGDAIRGSGFGELWSFIRSDSWDGPDLLPAQHRGVPIDLLLVDAGHAEHEVRRDVAAWLPLVRPGAPVWFHDYVGSWNLAGVAPEDLPQVKPVVDELVAAGVLEPVKEAGWGWLGVKQ